MLVDLVQVTTRDGFRLDGAYLAPAGPQALPLDALCFVHGTGGNFYSSTLFDALADRLRALGCGVVRVNTRGHDGISTASTGRGGSPRRSSRSRIPCRMPFPPPATSRSTGRTSATTSFASSGRWRAPCS